MRMASGRLCFLLYMLVALRLIVASADDKYGSKDTLKKPQREKFLSTNIGVQGLVYCKSGSKLSPIEGAVTRITCEAVEEYGLETTPLSFLSGATDEKGYFLATLSPWEVRDKRSVVKQCRAYLELSPSLNCTEPTDLNKGITGASLRFHRFLTHNNMNLYNVGPFSFTTPSPP